MKLKPSETRRIDPMRVALALGAEPAVKPKRLLLLFPNSGRQHGGVQRPFKASGASSTLARPTKVS